MSHAPASSAAQFKTRTYRPNFPARFGRLEDASALCQPCLGGDNTAHRQSGSSLRTLAIVHDGPEPQGMAGRATTVPAAPS